MLSVRAAHLLASITTAALDTGMRRGEVFYETQIVRLDLRHRTSEPRALASGRETFRTDRELVRYAQARVDAHPHQRQASFFFADLATAP